MMEFIEHIKRCSKNSNVYYTRHAKLEMEKEEFGRIFEMEVYEAICDSEVIEKYFDDKPYPSALIFGRTKTGRPLHIVCALNSEEELAIVITVYQPNPELWIDYRYRRNKL